PGVRREGPGSPRSVERCGAAPLAHGRPPGRPASRRTKASSPEGTKGPGGPPHLSTRSGQSATLLQDPGAAGAAERAGGWGMRPLLHSGIAWQPGNFGLSDREVIEKTGKRGWHVLYITGRRRFRPGRDCIEWGGCFLTRRHGGAEKHAENMLGLASVLGTQRRKVKTGERGVSGDPTAAQRGSRWGGRLISGARGGYRNAV